MNSWGWSSLAQISPCWKIWYGFQHSSNKQAGPRPFAHPSNRCLLCSFSNVSCNIFLNNSNEKIWAQADENGQIVAQREKPGQGLLALAAQIIGGSLSVSVYLQFRVAVAWTRLLLSCWLRLLFVCALFGVLLSLLLIFINYKVVCEFGYLLKILTTLDFLFSNTLLIILAWVTQNLSQLIPTT